MFRDSFHRKFQLDDFVVLLGQETNAYLGYIGKFCKEKLKVIPLKRKDIVDESDEYDETIVFEGTPCYCYSYQLIKIDKINVKIVYMANMFNIIGGK